MKFIAYTIKGIEKLAAEEIEKTVPEAEILKIEEKAVIFESQISKFPEMTSLTTVDDIGLLVGEIEYTDKTNHAELTAAIDELNFEPARKSIIKHRSFKTSKFSLTVSLPRVQNLNSIKFKDDYAKHFAEQNGLEYLPTDHTNFDIRVFLGDKICVSVRLTAESLHKREYKEFAKRGSLRPTVAAALINIATRLGAKGKLVDNFCGSGTILAEGYLKGFEIYGGDIDSGSVTLTKQNLKNLDFENEENIRVQDATKTDFEDNQFDLAISNLPWGKQVQVDAFTNLIKLSLIEYKRILKKENVLVILSKHPEIVIEEAEKVFKSPEISTLEISMVGQQPVIVAIQNI